MNDTIRERRLVKDMFGEENQNRKKKKEKKRRNKTVPRKFPQIKVDKANRQKSNARNEKRKINNQQSTNLEQIKELSVDIANDCERR
jgi:hypothetical protein